MSCSEFRDLISKSLDTTLTPEEKGRLDAHLKRCDACKREMEIARNIFDACQNTPRPVLPSDFSTQVMNRLPKKKLVSVPKVRRLSYIAACLALIVLISSPALDNLRLSEQLDDTGPAPSSTATSTPSGLNGGEEVTQPTEKEDNGASDATAKNNVEDQDADKLNQKGGIKSIFGQGQTGGGTGETPAAPPVLPTLPQFNHPSSTPVAPPTAASSAAAEVPTPEATQSPEAERERHDEAPVRSPEPSTTPEATEKSSNSVVISPTPSPEDYSVYSAGSGGSAAEDTTPTPAPPQSGASVGGGMPGGSGSGSSVMGSFGGATAPKTTPVYEVVLRRSDEEKITAVLELLAIAYNNDGATLTAQTTYKQYRAILQALDEQGINYITSNADNPGDWQQVEVVFRFQ